MATVVDDKQSIVNWGAGQYGGRMNVFDHLTPDVMLTAVEAQGFVPTGALMPLNSYENRVYEIALDEAAPIVAKFYRPNRWSAATIAEEHRFVLRAHEMEVPTVAPLALRAPSAVAATVGEHGGYCYALYPKFRGQMRPEMSIDELRWLGRTLARLHNVAAQFTSAARIQLTPQTYGHASVPVILQLECIPAVQRDALTALLPQAVALTEHAWNTHEWTTLPIHGDCHHGNVLWNHDGPHLLDFDDMVVAPPVQDLWMLQSGPADEQRAQRAALLEGYTLFRPFDERAFLLSEPLRTLRMIHHAAWLASRHDEPAFQQAFPYFTQARYWEEFAQMIREQIGVMQEFC